MDLREAQILARTAMKAHGLYGWTFEFNNRKGAFGLCRHSRRTIQLSRLLTQHANKAQVQQTIGHEIAHALVGPGAGHGPVWRAKMREMGLTPDRCGEASDAQKIALASAARYVVTCSVNGKQVATMNRLVKSRTVQSRGMFDMPRTKTYKGHKCKCHGEFVLYNGKSFEDA